MRVLNKDLLDWVRADRTFRVARQRAGARRDLAVGLDDMEAHLLMRHAKYEAWIPNRPENAVVYLADEQEHGLAYPPELDTIAAKLL